MKKKICTEKPFEYLRRQKTNEPFPEETVRNWYIARSYVLHRLENCSFAPEVDGHLHIVIAGDTPLMLAVLRQVALSAHYPNYVEADPFNHLLCRNRTVITLVSNKDANDIVAELGKEENLGNLLQFCKCSVYGDVRNEDSYIDVELEITQEADNEPGCILFEENDIKAYLEGEKTDDIFSVDTRKAVYAQRSYEVGTQVDNITHENINGTGRHSQALETFQYHILQDKKGLQLITEEWKDNLTAVKNGLSNVICADCFESRELAIRHLCPDYDILSDKDKKAIWENNIIALSISEHSRWVVEKLILGFRPMSDQERACYESLFGAKRKAYYQKLKNNAVSPVHIDLRSYRDLRRADPDNLKYDSFLMLAIPLILDKIRKDDKRKS
jgi:hypothetical protein